MKKNYLIFCLLFISQYNFAQNALLQGWYWEYPKTDVGAHWADTMQLRAPDLSNNGFGQVWLPPLSRSSSIPNNSSNGYNIKDLFDLGEFGLGPTGFGTRQELNNTISTFNTWNINAVADMIYNHRDGGRADDNPSVAGWINNFTLPNCVYPSDRFRCYLPLGGASGNGAGDYYLKISSKTGNAAFYGKPYTMYVTTNRNNAYVGSSSESEPNDGCDCNCADTPDVLALNTDLSATLDGDACLTDEFKVTLNAGDYYAAGDTLWIYLTNQNSDYADHRIYGIWSAAANADIIGQLKYQTYTNFSNLPSGRGAMNHTNFKPNGNPTDLCGDLNFPLFFYDYDHTVPATRDTLTAWTRWMYQNVGIKGMRMDAVKHFEPSFLGYMLTQLHNDGINTGLVVGENINSAGNINAWIDAVYSNMSGGASDSRVTAFDFPLRWALKNACDQFGYDARQVFNSGVVAEAGGNPFNVVTFVNNHDYRTSGEAVQNNPILGYAYTLTNNQIGLPSIFYPDYYGSNIPYMPNAALKPEIDALLNVHRNFIEGSSAIDYLSRINTPYGSNYIEGQASTTLLYQLYNTPTGNDVVVAINFSGTPLRLDHVVNTGTGGLATGDTLVDVLGRSAYPYAIVNSSNQMYVELPPRSYSVWVRCNNPSAPDCIPVQGTNFKGKVWLEGAYNASNNYMRPTLRNANLVPKTQPYNVAPFNYGGAESVPAVRNLPPNVVDWVIIEARNSTDTALIARCAAFVRADGVLLNEWGNDNIHIPNLTSGNYFIAIKHRNHLPILSNNPIALPNATAFDFADAANIEGGATQAVAVASGVYAMPAGDATIKGTITFADYNAYKQYLGTNNVYNNADLNLDGNINATDFNLYRQNAGRLAVRAIR
jgi:hypothetical protein